MEIRGAGAPSPHAGVFEKGKRKEGRGLVVPGKTKSEAVVTVILEDDVTECCTRLPRPVDPRTPAKGVFTGRNLALLLTPVIASLHTYTVAF